MGVSRSKQMAIRQRGEINALIHFFLYNRRSLGKRKGNIKASSPPIASMHRSQIQVFTEKIATPERCGSIATASSQACLYGNAFDQMNIRIMLMTRLSLKQFDSFDHKIRTIGWQGGIGACENIFVMQFHMQSIAQRNGLKNRRKVMIAIWNVDNNAQK